MPTTPRPPLPTRHANPHIPATLKSGIIPPVKYQILNCQGQDILVGRLKIETPTANGHAFILRRFDTGAVSLTTMFRAAFPNAPDNEERLEMQWVKENYDLSGNNGSPQYPHITRLAGTWISPALARTFGDTYALGDLITAVLDAKPDPNVNYRRSGRTGANVPVTATPAATNGPVTTNGTAHSPTQATSSPKASAAARSLPTPSPSFAQPNPPKRRKELSLSPAPQASQAAQPPSSPSKIPLPRRSARTKSPAPQKGMPTPLTSMTKTPKMTRITRSSVREEVVTPGGSDETVVEEESVVVEEGMAGSELHQQDIAEQKEMIENLKAKRDAALKSKEKEELAEEEGQDEDKENEPVAAGPSISKKRSREEEEPPLRFDFKEPEVGERAIATNRRVGRFHMEPRTKSFAWGVAAFAIGMGAVSFLPNLFG